MQSRSSSSIARTLLFLTGMAGVLMARALLRLKIVARRDGWRRGAGLVLRGPAATFELSAFSLNVWSEAHRPDDPSFEATRERLADRLREFLAGQREHCLRIRC